MRGGHQVTGCDRSRCSRHGSQGGQFADRPAASRVGRGNDDDECRDAFHCNQGHNRGVVLGHGLSDHDESIVFLGGHHTERSDSAQGDGTPHAVGRDFQQNLLSLCAQGLDVETSDKPRLNAFGGLDELELAVARTRAAQTAGSAAATVAIPVFVV